MATQIIGMYAAGTGGTENAAATIDVPEDGFITGIDWDCTADMDADGEAFACELSFIATSQLIQNDVRGRISSVGTTMSLTTSGVSNPPLQKYVSMNTPVFAGERIHLHLVTTSGMTSTARCNVHLDVSMTRLSRRFARRQ
jgi:hypothetical protein